MNKKPSPVIRIRTSETVVYKGFIVVIVWYNPDDRRPGTTTWGFKIPILNDDGLDFLTRKEALDVAKQVLDKAIATARQGLDRALEKAFKNRVKKS